MIAILVLFAVATLAALFAAIISSHLAQTGRRTDVVQLRNIAEAGLRFANEQLTYSLEGADWRPSQKVYRSGGGDVSVEVSYGPDPSPGRLQTRFVRVVASAVFPDNPFLRHTVLALKPLLLTDYARFITDRFETGRPAALGVTGVEYPTGLGRETIPFRISGPVRSNTQLYWYGPSRVELFTKDANVNLFRDDRIEVAGDFRPGNPEITPVSGLSVLNLFVDGVSRASDVFHPATGTESLLYMNGYPDALRSDNTADPNTCRVLASLPPYTPAGGADPLPAPYLAVPRVRPPLMDAVQPELLTNRYLALTRDSGEWKSRIVGQRQEFYNTGLYGWGWTNYGGLYIDNREDIQYNHDLEKLRLNWVGSVGVHDTNLSPAPRGDQRTTAAASTVPTSPPLGPADWWDRTARYYAPPGVEIVLHGESKCPYLEITRDDVKGATGSQYYWQGPDGTVVSATGTLPYSSVPGYCLPLGTGHAVRVEQAAAYFPFPPNGVIYADGNVRIRGIMPPARPGPTAGVYPTTYFDAGGYSKTDGQRRRFDLQVVSGGTIYIEGDLLTPGPLGAGLAVQGATTPLTLDDELAWGSRLALIARDYVCLNTTALNPRPQDLLSAPLDGSNNPQYYNDLQPRYPRQQYPQYAFAQGDPELDPTPGNWDDTTPIPTIPANITYTYRSVRLAAFPANYQQMLDLRLIIGHSAWYMQDGTQPWEGADDITPSPPTMPTDKKASVQVEQLAVNETPVWDASDPYTFVADAGSGTTKSGVWFNFDSTSGLPANGVPEFLPIAGRQTMALSGITLTGRDTLTFTPKVMPVREQAADGSYSWVVRPDELGYLLGPIAIAPPRYMDINAEDKQVMIPLQVQVQALIYAQNGSWFIIPGPWFNEDFSTKDSYPSVDYPAYHEPLNICISVYGAISENMPAPLGDVADWTGKWGGMFTAPPLPTYLSYAYDPLLRYTRSRVDPLSPQGNTTITTVRFPGFPLTPDLMVWGERISGQAGG